MKTESVKFQQILIKFTEFINPASGTSVSDLVLDLWDQNKSTGQIGEEAGHPSISTNRLWCSSHHGAPAAR
jgi:hypothetical protein